MALRCAVGISASCGQLPTLTQDIVVLPVWPIGQVASLFFHHAIHPRRPFLWWRPLYRRARLRGLVEGLVAAFFLRSRKRLTLNRLPQAVGPSHQRRELDDAQAFPLAVR